MEVRVLEQGKNSLRLELVTQDQTLAHLLTKELWKDSDVTVSGYNLLHPQTSNIVIVVETTKKDPKKVILECLSDLKKRSSEFKSQFQKIVK